MRDVYVKNQIRCQLDVQRNQKLLGKNESLKYNLEPNFITYK